MRPRPQLSHTADTQGRVSGLSYGGTPVDAATRSRLLAEARAGTVTQSLRLDVLAFRQDSKANRNHVRFKPSALAKLATSFVGAPFLRDHQQRDFGARGGTIVDSKLVEHDGGHEIHQTLELVKPWAIEAALDGTLDRFSIGFLPNSASQPQCSVCEHPIISHDCKHLPGSTSTLKDGSKRVCEMLYTDADGIEVSAVNVPAVQGTGIQEIRTALSEWRGGDIPKEKDMLTIARKILGLAEDASEDVAVKALEALNAQTTTLRTELATAQKQSAELAVKLAAIETSAQAAKVAGLLEGAVRDGKIRPELAGDGKTRVETPMEKAVRALAETSFAAAEQLVASLPRVVPIAEGLRSTETNPPKRKVEELSAVEENIIAQTGVKREDYLKTRAAQEGI